jgi:hypothetical protein
VVSEVARRVPGRQGTAGGSFTGASSGGRNEARCTGAAGYTAFAKRRVRTAGTAAGEECSSASGTAAGTAPSPLR